MLRRRRRRRAPRRVQISARCEKMGEVSRRMSDSNRLKIEREVLEVVPTQLSFLAPPRARSHDSQARACSLECAGSCAGDIASMLCVMLHVHHEPRVGDDAKGDGEEEGADDQPDACMLRSTGTRPRSHVPHPTSQSVSPPHRAPLFDLCVRHVTAAGVGAPHQYFRTRKRQTDCSRLPVRVFPSPAVLSTPFVHVPLLTRGLHVHTRESTGASATRVGLVLAVGRVRPDKARVCLSVWWCSGAPRLAASRCGSGARTPATQSIRRCTVLFRR